MKKSLKQIVFVAMALFLASCSSEIFNEGNELEKESSNVEITASQEQIKNDGEVFETTRTALAPNNSGNINWVVGDCVNIFDGTSNRKFAVTSTSGNICTFSSQGAGVSKGATDFAAAYPYDMETTYSNGKLCGIVLPNNQEATDGGFDPTCNIMVARSSVFKTTFKFKHVCSYIKVRIAFDCSRIVIEFNDKNIVAAGKFDVEVSETDAPKIENVKGVSEEPYIVRLLGDIKANTDYYIAVLPGTYIGGFKVTLDPKNSRDMIDWKAKSITISPRYREGRNDLVLNRAYDKSLGLFTMGNGGNTIAEDNTKTISFEDILGYESSKGNATGKIVLWSKMNLGANEETDDGGYYAWGETELRTTPFTYDNYLCKDYYPENLDQAHDAAAVTYGKGWRIPSDVEFTELKENTIWKYDITEKGYYVYPKGVVNGKEVADVQMYSNGKLVHCPTGLDQDIEEIKDQEIINYVNGLTPGNSKHIFFKSAGVKQNGDNVIEYETKGAYWTSGRGKTPLYSTSMTSQLTAYYLGFYQDSKFNMKSYYNTRFAGLSIRPVFVIEW